MSYFYIWIDFVWIESKNIIFAQKNDCYPFLSKIYQTVYKTEYKVKSS